MLSRVNNKVNLKNLLKKYSYLSFMEKLHIWLRLLLCPWNEILKHFPDGNILTDIGCGHGLFTNLVDMSRGSFKKIVGIDLSANKIDVAKRSENGRVKFKVSSLNDIKESADVYSIFDVLYLISFEEQEKLIRQIYDRLPRGGYLVLKEISKRPFWKYVFNYSEEIIMVKLLKVTMGKNLYFHSQSEFLVLLTKIGFQVKVIDIHRRNIHPHIMFICKKYE